MLAQAAPAPSSRMRSTTQGRTRAWGRCPPISTWSSHRHTTSCSQQQHAAPTVHNSPTPTQLSGLSAISEPPTDGSRSHALARSSARTLKSALGVPARPLARLLPFARLGKNLRHQTITKNYLHWIEPPCTSLSNALNSISERVKITATLDSIAAFRPILRF